MTQLPKLKFDWSTQYQYQKWPNIRGKMKKKPCSIDFSDWFWLYTKTRFSDYPTHHYLHISKVQQELLSTDIINPFKLIFQDECQNYVRVLAQTDSQSLLVCGTNSFKPKCRTYTTVREVLKTPNNTDGAGTSNSKSSSTTTTILKTSNSTNSASTTTTTETSTPELIDDGILRMKHEFSGRGVCPLDPRHNSTAIYTGMLYTSGQKN